MLLQELRLYNVRSYSTFSTQIHPNLTLVVGPNGTGKTTLLEAIYYMYRGTSFRGKDRDMLAHDSTRSEIKTVQDNGEQRHSTMQEDSQSIKRGFSVKGKKTARIPQKHKIPVVLFEPDELRSLSSSPEKRRKFFDGILSRLYPHYATILNRYQRTLLQRNELLKQRENITEKDWDSQMFVWDMKLAELALEITRQRREFVVVSNNLVGQLYSKLANSQNHVLLSYHSQIPADNYQQQILNYLHKNRIGDSYRGYTSVGPHRDDFQVQLNGHPATETASRGEMRTIMLAYKLLEIDLQKDLYQISPLVLLDDVFSELDIERERNLMENLLPFQTIITTTDLRQKNPENALVINLD